MAMERLAEDLITFSRLLRPLQHAEMTPQQYWLLRQLRRDGLLSIGELAHTLGITTGSATVACKRLEQAGLLTRERRSDDERVVQVTLTEQGRAQIDALRQRRRDALVHLLAVLNEREQQVMQDMIERLLEAAETQGFAEERQHDSHH